ncbi:hypothetical protein [Winogradskyella tangerina]|uniref:hypothetical protein n=1 Tax=Winogradskyella tangerina TaxID=2023240 RepID=UPI000DBE2E17|nr:hypothetical protein [Winogradskyella tangerina]
MKLKTSFILIGIALLLSSCIVKSIQPFYTAESQFFDDRLEGEYITKSKKTWKFVSFKTEWEKENQDQTKLMKEDIEAYERYKDSYVVEYVTKDDDAVFIAMPFKVDDHLFLDFTPFYYEDSGLNSMVAQHLLKTHSAAKVDFNDDGSIKLSWISESVIKRLFNEQKIRLKHEKVGIDEDLVLTSNSEELHSFLRKFMKADFENKWDNDDIMTLNPHDAKP